MGGIMCDSGVRVKNFPTVTKTINNLWYYDRNHATGLLIMSAILSLDTREDDRYGLHLSGSRPGLVRTIATDGG